ncbi:MAG: hypothetical protein K2P58_02100 [Hyphomonadaceae bacterium]|nr:hypothetical protein [Hyphomonadaceae bacterium]
MTQQRTLALSGGADLRERALNAVRPGIEALLLAAVALGCAQASWTILAPNPAGAFNAADDQQDATRLHLAQVVTPFAPALLDSAGPSHAALALLSGVQVSGVRIADDPARSGAILTLNDGSQKAFLVGQEISAGVTLSEVSASYVLVSYPGGTQQLSMATSSQGFSFARALMGQGTDADAAEPAPAAASFSPVDAPIALPPAVATAPLTELHALTPREATPLSVLFHAGLPVFAEYQASVGDAPAPPLRTSEAD